MTLDEYLASFGFTELEGHCQQVSGQVRVMKAICKHTNIRNMLEIGFNAGHSANLILQANPHLHLTSYDIGDHEYTKIGKQYIDIMFPGRHTLVLGDSKVTVPKDTKKYDAFFIDGGHDYETALADILNCKVLANQSAIVLVDDVILTESMAVSYTIGPTKAVGDCVRNGLIDELFIWHFCHGRGMFSGYYN
jgi:predicted O-methyltransferase YrrM